MKHYYSVPYVFTGSMVKVIYTRNMVYLYADGKQISQHIRSYKPGSHSSIREHLSSQNQFYVARCSAYYLDRAKDKPTALHHLIGLIFEQNRYPEQLYRVFDSLLRLQKNTAAETFDRACNIAAEHGVFSYKFIQRILENNMADFWAQPTLEQPLPVNINIRGKEYFTQLIITK